MDSGERFLPVLPGTFGPIMTFKHALCHTNHVVVNYTINILDKKKNFEKLLIQFTDWIIYESRLSKYDLEVVKTIISKTKIHGKVIYDITCNWMCLSCKWSTSNEVKCICVFRIDTNGKRDNQFLIRRHERNFGESKDEPYWYANQLYYYEGLNSIVVWDSSIYQVVLPNNQGKRESHSATRIQIIKNFVFFRFSLESLASSNQLINL